MQVRQRPFGGRRETGGDAIDDLDRHAGAIQALEPLLGGIGRQPLADQPADPPEADDHHRPVRSGRRDDRHGRGGRRRVAQAERGAHRQTICLTPRRKAPRRIVADTALASTLLKRRTHSERRVRRRRPHDLPRQDLLDHALDLRRASQALRQLVHRAAVRAVGINGREELVLERRIVAQRDARGGRGRRRRRGACATAAAEPRVRRADVQRRRVRELHTHTLNVPGR